MNENIKLHKSTCYGHKGGMVFIFMLSRRKMKNLIKHLLIECVI